MQHILYKNLAPDKHSLPIVARLDSESHPLRATRPSGNPPFEQHSLRATRPSGNPPVASCRSGRFARKHSRGLPPEEASKGPQSLAGH